MTDDAARSLLQTRRNTLWLFLLFWGFYSLMSSGRIRLIDEAMPLFQTQSLVLRGQLTVPQAVTSDYFFGKRDIHGNPRSPYPPLQSVLATPWYALGHFILCRLPGISSQIGDLVEAYAVTLSNAFYAALILALAFQLFLRMGLSSSRALFATLAIGLATPLFPYSRWFLSEPLTMLVWSLTLFILSSTDGVFSQDLSWMKLALGGIVAGLSVWVRPNNIFFILPLAAGLAVSPMHSKLRRLAELGLAFALPVAAYLAYNWSIFNNPFDFGYPDAVEGGQRIFDFGGNFGEGLIGLLLSPGKSVFIFFPALLPILAGLGSLLRKQRYRPLTTVVALNFLICAFFISHYKHWEGGYCYGPRYLIPALYLFSLAIGPLLERFQSSHTFKILRPLVLFLLFAGLPVQLLGSLTSFLEAQAQTDYYEANYNYNPNYSALRTHGALLQKYLLRQEAAPLGRGIDLWFVFLGKAGMPERYLLLASIAQLGAGMLAAIQLWRGNRSLLTFA